MIQQKLIMNVRESLRSIVSSKARSTLTMLGIIIGISAVIIMLGLGKGAQQLLVDQVKTLGSNIVFVLAGGDGGEKRGPPAAARGIVTKTLTYDDLRAVEKNAQRIGVQKVSAFTSSIPVTFKEENQDSVSINVRGRDRNFFLTKELVFTEGGLWSYDEENSLARVAVIGGTAKEKVFGVGSGSALGKKLRIKENNYTIVGVLKKQSAGLTSLFGQDDDLSILIPTKTMMKVVLGIDYLTGLQMESLAPSKKGTEEVMNKLEKVLRDAHNLREEEESDFSVRSQQDAIEIFTVITDVFTVFLAAIAAISLLVGGIGIMNIMIVTVTERTFEIGLRKALGAKKSDILFQFLVEAMVLTIFGGLIGVAIGILGTFGLSLLGGWTFTIDIQAILIATVVSGSFGLLFGMYPAYKASKLDPIQALRYE